MDGRITEENSKGSCKVSLDATFLEMIKDIATDVSLFVISVVLPATKQYSEVS